MSEKNSYATLQVQDYTGPSKEVPMTYLPFSQKLKSVQILESFVNHRRSEAADNEICILAELFSNLQHLY